MVFMFLALIFTGMANGVVIPPSVWWLFGIECFCILFKAFVETIKNR